MSNLYAASRQWATRPDDERFESLEALYDASRAHYDTAGTALVKYGDLRVNVVPDADDVQLAHVSGNIPLTFTDYSFKQLNTRLGYDARTLAKLPATITADAMNFGLQQRGMGSNGDRQDDVNILFHENGTAIFRAITGKVYERVWNWEVAKFLIELQQADSNWRIPPARPVREGQKGTRRATEADVLDGHENFDLAIQVGDPIAPAGLYASAHDMFAFVVNQSKTLVAGKEVLNRGVFVRNSEVGDASLIFTKFLWSRICGNHISWDVSDVEEISFRHVGKSLRTRVSQAIDRVRVATEASAAEDEERLRKLRVFLLGDTKDEVMEIATRRNMLSQKIAGAAFELAQEYSDNHGDPRSAWGFVAGLTRLSQQTAYADKRTEMDRIGGKILQLAGSKN